MIELKEEIEGKNESIAAVRDTYNHEKDCFEVKNRDPNTYTYLYFDKFPYISTFLSISLYQYCGYITYFCETNLFKFSNLIYKKTKKNNHVQKTITFRFMCTQKITFIISRTGCIRLGKEKEVRIIFFISFYFCFSYFLVLFYFSIHSHKRRRRKRTRTPKTNPFPCSQRHKIYKFN